MLQHLKKIWEHIREIGNREVKIFQSAPPYILIGILYVLQQRNDAEQVKHDQHAAEVRDFNDCVGTARARISNQENSYDLYDYIKIDLKSPDVAEDLKERFDIRFNKNKIKSVQDCLNLYPDFSIKDIPPER